MRISVQNVSILYCVHGACIYLSTIKQKVNLECIIDFSDYNYRNVIEDQQHQIYVQVLSKNSLMPLLTVRYYT